MWPSLRGLVSYSTLLLFLGLSACGGDGTGPDDPGDDQGIGSSGGTASLQSGSVVLTVPAGALSSSVTFTAQATTSIPSGSLAVSGSTYDIGPTGTTFAQPVTLTLGYSEGSLPTGVQESELRLFKVVNGGWEMMGNASVNTASNTVSGQVTSLSTYGAVATPVASVDVAPASGDVEVGGSAQFTATAKDSEGNTLSQRTISWTSSDSDVATVGTSGEVTGVGEGSATITATSEGESGTASVTVTDQVTSVDVSPATSSVTPGTTVQLTASAKGVTGNTLGRTITWASSAPAVATVDASGLVTGVSEGTATITATADGVDGTAEVAVTIPVASVDVTPATSQINAGGTAQLVATPKDSQGNALTRSVTWSSSGDAVATVDQSGLVTGVSAGQVTITASSGDVNGTATVTVADPVSTVTVSPAESILTSGETVQLTAVAEGATGNTIAGDVTWASSDQAVATVDQDGLVTAVAPGQATITATQGGVDGTATITVPLSIPDLAGNWAGTWVNITFGSNGPVTLVITVNETDQTVTFTLDVDGPAFGGGDPPEVTYNGTYADGVMTVTGTNASFGTLNFTWSAQGVSGMLTQLPAGSGINSVALNGAGTTTQLNMTYDIDGVGWSANGTFAMTKN